MIKGIVKEFCELFMDSTKLEKKRNEALEKAIEKDKLTEKHAKLASQLNYANLSSEIYEKLGHINEAAHEASKAGENKRASQLYEKCEEYVKAWKQEDSNSQRAHDLAELAVKNKEKECIHIIAKNKFPKKTIDLVIESTIQLIQKSIEDRMFNSYYGGFGNSKDRDEKEINTPVIRDLAKVLNEYKSKEKISMLRDIAPYLERSEGIKFLRKVLSPSKIKDWISQEIEYMFSSKQEEKEKIMRGLWRLASEEGIRDEIIENYLQNDEIKKTSILVKLLESGPNNLMKDYKNKGNLKLIRNLRLAIGEKHELVRYTP